MGRPMKNKNLNPSAVNNLIPPKRLRMIILGCLLFGLRNELRYELLPTYFLRYNSFTSKNTLPIFFNAPGRKAPLTMISFP